MRNKFFFLTFGVLISVFFLLSPLSHADAQPSLSWNEWVQQLRQEALGQGIRPEVFDEAFKNVKAPDRQVLRFDKSQPEKRITFLKYRDTRADAFRIKLGRQEYRKYHDMLSEIGRQFGVSPCFIVSLWGLETSYGRFMGKFPVIQSLATLAYDTRRSEFFRKQLLYALQILNGNHVDLKDFKGEWAGASGQPQFLPSSWHHYAVDYNRDGKKDIWRTHADIFASIANYLVQHGWKTGQPWAIPVMLPANFDETLINSKNAEAISKWKSMGVHTIQGRPWPEDENLTAELIRPLGGPDMLIFNNFNVLMKWNHSNYYAGTVGWMAEQVCGRSL